MSSSGACMKTELVVATGEVKTGNNGETIIVRALGSCVALVIFDNVARSGGIAHIMLPGTFPKPGKRKTADGTKYACDGLKLLLSRIEKYGSKKKDLNVFLLGGANVLGKNHESPGLRIVETLLNALEVEGMKPSAMEIGGFERRSCNLDLESGVLTYTVGDSEKMVLWKAQ